MSQISVSTTNASGQPTQPDESEKGRHMINEPDIGSGEKTPGERETEEQIRQISPNRQSDPSREPAKP
ncbi:hypothetical protein [Pseudoduganella buxea]|uniref:Uncharacterized protein n=1 Tax=Pseudoduganella buxea TaxID=1949069 RepID=A0A6I3SWB8_9BURK|nr:hypothetical protein [Pseudoduganella buxea]MTV52816.1 hypothetical protein [Pseudoduganella buxea]GGC02132.1 hypothetical protein GCM10011572_25100 [Pseudoduganella buxea]